ncbi:MAG: CPBP family intramembrane metalloprotease [Verrucomicrobiae bacterium]|nr:CPBP family intramembrane metalloprotease [Verrucomicrobiae bacterium]
MSDVPPPILDGHPAPAAPVEVPRWRTVLMLLVVGAYPLAVGVISARGIQGAAAVSGTALPRTTSGLLAVCAENLGIFGVLFVLTWLIGRPTRCELHASGGPRLREWLLGMAHSVTLRIGLAGVALAALGIAAAVLSLKGRPLDALDGVRPQVEHLLDPAALRQPVYLLLTMTLVSFLVAGLREELWRAVVIAGILRLHPGDPRALGPRLWAIGVAALIFGFGHLPQGWGGVGLTAVLGMGLGAILVFHRSLWVAVLAHGFFDATSFALIRVADQMGALDSMLGR